MLYHISLHGKVNLFNSELKAKVSPFTPNYTNLGHSMSSTVPWFLSICLLGLISEKQLVSDDRQ